MKFYTNIRGQPTADNFSGIFQVQNVIIFRYDLPSSSQRNFRLIKLMNCS